MLRFRKFLKEKEDLDIIDLPLSFDEKKDREEYIQTIIDDCRPFLETFKDIIYHQHTPLYRAFGIENNNELVKYNTNRNRSPRGMNPMQQKVMDDFFEKKFGKRYRSSSTFASFDLEALARLFQWEEKPMCFIIGDFNFCYSVKAPDMIYFWQATNLIDDNLNHAKSQAIVDKIVEKYMDRYPWIIDLSKKHGSHNTDVIEAILGDPQKFKIYFNLLAKEFDYKENIIVDGIETVELMFDCDSYYLIDCGSKDDDDELVNDIYENL